MLSRTKKAAPKPEPEEKEPDLTTEEEAAINFTNAFNDGMTSDRRNLCQQYLQFMMYNETSCSQTVYISESRG